MKVKIVPTVLVYDVVALEEKLSIFDGLVERVQLDVIDEEFAAKPTLDLERMLGQQTGLDKDVHLMTAEPIDYLQFCADEAIKMVVGQIEAMSNQKEFVDEARRLELKVGLAVDLETNFKELDWEIAKTADQLLIMTVRAGREGQKFNRKGLEKVAQLRKKGFDKEICVDGGVNEKTIAGCVKAGADVLAVGSVLREGGSVKENLEKLTKLALNAGRG